MRCWWCGVEPDRKIDTSSLGSVFSTRAAGMWPPGSDHEHAVEPPTPHQLEQAGHDALSRILATG